MFDKFKSSLSNIGTNIGSTLSGIGANIANKFLTTKALVGDYLTGKRTINPETPLGRFATGIEKANKFLETAPIISDIGYKIPRKYGEMSANAISEGVKQTISGEKSQIPFTNKFVSGHFAGPLQIAGGVLNLTSLGVLGNYAYEGATSASTPLFPKGSEIPMYIGLVAGILTPGGESQDVKNVTKAAVELDKFNTAKSWINFLKKTESIAPKFQTRLNEVTSLLERNGMTLNKFFTQVKAGKTIKEIFALGKITSGKITAIQTGIKEILDNPGLTDVQKVEQIAPLTRQLDKLGAPFMAKTIDKVTDIAKTTEKVGTKVGEVAPVVTKELTPVQKVMKAIGVAEELTPTQQALYSEELGKRFVQAESAGQAMAGEAGAQAFLGKLSGNLPRVTFESIRKQLTSKDIDGLFDMITKNADLLPGEKATTIGALQKLLGSKGMGIPAEHELRLLDEVFGSAFTKAILDKRPLFKKFMDTVGQVAAIPRSIMASFDLSAPGRQGIFAAYGNPKEWSSAFKAQFKNFASDEAFKAAQAEIKSRSTYQLMRQSKLALMDMGTMVGKREEAFASSLAEKLPLGIGAGIKASGRAYTGFLNKYRADLFDKLYNAAQSAGKVTIKQLDDIANFVNTATGRGSLGKFESSMGILSTALFSPRLIASRMNLLNPVYYAKLSPVARKAALKSALTFVAGTAAVLYAAKLAGAEVELDPTSSDFAKIKIGDTRIDIMGGFQQYLVLLGRIVEGKYTSSTTGKTTYYGEGFNAKTRADAVWQFLQNKESPVISFMSAMLEQSDAAGEPIDVKKEIISRVTPLVLQDFYDLYSEGGMKALPLGIPGIFGFGTQTYGPSSVPSSVTGKFRSSSSFRTGTSKFR